MKARNHILILLAFATTAIIADDEVLPSVSAEKMSEYKNAFGKAIMDSRGKLPEAPGGVGGSRPGAGRIDGGLQGVTRKMREGLDKGGPVPPPGGPNDKGGGGGFSPTPSKGMPGGGPPPPGFGGPGQPGGPRPGGFGEGKAPPPQH